MRIESHINKNGDYRGNSEGNETSIERFNGDAFSIPNIDKNAENH